MSLSEKSLGGRATTDSVAQTDIQAPAQQRTARECLPAANAAAGCGELDARRLALCVATLESIACELLDSLELLSAIEDDGNGLPSRLMEGRLLLMGMEVDRTLKALGSSVSGLDDWLIKPRQLQALQALGGQA